MDPPGHHEKGVYYMRVWWLAHLVKTDHQTLPPGVTPLPPGDPPAVILRHLPLTVSHGYVQVALVVVVNQEATWTKKPVASEVSPTFNSNKLSNREEEPG